jgi:hypothetical protein
MVKTSLPLTTDPAAPVESQYITKLFVITPLQSIGLSLKTFIEAKLPKYPVEYAGTPNVIGPKELTRKSSPAKTFLLKNKIQETKKFNKNFLIIYAAKNPTVKKQVQIT